jgi:gliding motility-associated-like protein
MTIFKTIKYLSRFLTLFLPCIVLGQTVNTGDVVVTSGTVFSTVADFNNTATGRFVNDGDVYIYANWNNDGVVDFLEPTGLTRYVGENTQLISGSEYSYLYNALFNNASAQPAFNLSGAISVANESAYRLGIVDNDNFGGIFQFEQDAYHVFTSNDSHVDGAVEKVGDNPFEYPIGDAGYFRFAGISDSDTTTEVFSGKYFFESTNTNYPVANTSGNITLIDRAEHWTIENTSATLEVLVTLSWNLDTTPSDILVAPYEAIHIVRWDAALQLWVDEGGVVDTTAQTVTTAVSDYGVFTLARIREDRLLPCALTVVNLITPNGDGMNDFFEVRQAVNDSSCAQNVKVIIFNRWGAKVYEGENYDTTSTPFGGYSEGKRTINKGEKLPTGTYFYILTFNYQDNGSTNQYKKAGYLYINGN